MSSEAPFGFLFEKGTASKSSVSSPQNRIEEVDENDENISFAEYCPCCYRVRGGLCENFETNEKETNEKIRGVRVLLYAQGLDGVLVPSGDAHSSEYVAACDERRAWLTGFSGSAGIALITKKEALLWTDGRYFNQAENQLKNTDIQLMRQNEPDVPEPGEFCAQNKNLYKIGIDPTTCTLNFAEEFRRQISSTSSKPITLIATEGNLIDIVWSKQRPTRPCNEIIPQPIEFTGASVEMKLIRLRAWLDEKKIQGIVLNTLDQIAWLTNLRGSDIECNPVFFSYAVVTIHRAVLFAGGTDVNNIRTESSSLDKHLGQHWEIFPYISFGPKAVSSICLSSNSRTSSLIIALERSTATMAMSLGLEEVGIDLRLIDVSPIEYMKAIKNQTEIQGLRQAQIRDAAVLCTFFAWLEEEIMNKKQNISEAQAADKITKLRSLFIEQYRGDSFPTISSSGANAAIIHYQPTHENCSMISSNNIYLCDTGAQYIDGTTDITRTIYIGGGEEGENNVHPSVDALLCYTLVLMGHIDLARINFPDGISGLQLDAIARAPLWTQGFDFNHGTGHGMGAYLNVHEGPMGIGGGALPASKLSNAAKLRYLSDIHSGYYLSNEPGIYIDNKFGFRLESDLLVIDCPHSLRGKTLGATRRKFLSFEYLTLVPFCRNLIDPSLLAPYHRTW
eukprot:CAMPEP_0197318772 /NCGR_PEP_ID=MMETSP0891-20130614/52377_1 /TAXON_ID=44058 ORGANISM="Aureoumbra lagunensis, Strain CCMP1510" /NCGR_SAMPLE_ID=MMETSP0891 /ASSEMBLY_ACC=CAM_ASM_000534 /LENGTH=675 /DNA_ID=CAMNT_0042809381 /DNA_START=37 /DNA_END=2061 /DNA_ORIENTATION=+